MKLASILLAFFYVLVFMKPVFASDYPTDLTGEYECNSYETDTNKHYHGIMKLEKTGEVYAVRSAFDDDSTYFGPGIYDYVHHQFALSFFNSKDQTEIAVALDEVGKDYSHVSKWVFLDKKIVSSAVCIKKQSVTDAGVIISAVGQKPAFD